MSRLRPRNYVTLLVRLAWSLPCFVFAGERVQAQEDLAPPRIVLLPEVTVPSDIEVPERGIVEAIVLVQSDGSAGLETCDAGEALCALVRESMAHARFEPARRSLAAVSARIRVALRVARANDTVERGQPAADSGEALSPARGGENVAALEPARAAASLQPSNAEDAYGARAEVQRTAQPGMRRLELAELRDMPGAFGDPFRAVEVLPGIVPLLSGLPYFYVRGSPPAGSVYYYDGIPVPSLYHLALGPAVVHPQMVGPIRLYSGVAPARYGRLTGGVIVGEGPPRVGTRSEAELRLLDVSGFVQTDALGGQLNVSGRYGYPGLVVSLVSPEVSLAYWDYQLRYAYPVTNHVRLELVALGSFDRLSTGPANDALELQFHRLDPRITFHRPHEELGMALMLGAETSALGETLEIASTRFSPRAWYEHRFDGGYRLRASADYQSLWGGVRRQAMDDAAIDTFGLRDLGRGQRSLFGAQLELSLPLTAAFEMQAGARVDAWLQERHVYPAVDPRLRVIWHANETLDVHVAAGTTHQPAAPIIPLPGLADYASARTLQSAVQVEAGAGMELPIDVRAELQLFAHRYRDLVFADTLSFGSISDLCERMQCMGERLPAHTDGWSYGMELFLRRPFTHTLSGVLSYTLAWANIDRVLGLKYTPEWDVRHLVNLVLQWDIGSGFALGVRGFFRSGKSSGEFYKVDGLLGRNELRLPGFFRGDFQFSYSWNTSWAGMRFGFEWFNFTISREPLAATSCELAAMGCQTEYAPPIFAPNFSLRATFH